MPVDNDKFFQGATRGDVGGAIITISIALSSVANALEEIKAGRDPSGSIRDVRDQVNKLDKMFDELTGYTPPDGS